MGPCSSCVYRRENVGYNRQVSWKCYRFPPSFIGPAAYYDSTGNLVQWDFPEVQIYHGCGEYKSEKKSG